jgi:drug/metabolite transporter (DMT)-like permease
MYYLLVILSVLAAAGAQMLLKQGAKQQYPTFIRQYINPWVIGGYGIMAASLLLNIFCLGHGVQVKEVSIIESLSYLFVPMLSWLIFKEKITWRKAGAIAVIMMGVVVFLYEKIIVYI